MLINSSLVSLYELTNNKDFFPQNPYKTLNTILCEPMSLRMKGFYRGVFFGSDPWFRTIFTGIVISKMFVIFISIFCQRNFSNKTSNIVKFRIIKKQVSKKYQ